MSLVKNLPTKWQETEKENWWLLKEGRLSMKNLLNRWWETEEENQCFMTKGWRSQKVEVLTVTVGWKSCAVTCNATKDGRLGRYPNLFKNPIKLKRSSLFSSFVSAVSWSSSLLFGRLCGLDCWFSHWWCNVNNRRSRSWFVRIIIVKWTDELFEVLDRWGWLLGILFLQISFSWNQIVEA